MSTLLERPVSTSKRVERKQPSARGKSPAAEPQVKPQIHIRARVIRKKQARVNVGAIVATKCLLFVTVMGLTYACSSLGGQLLLEGARQQRLEAKRRAHEATVAEKKLSEKLDRLTSAEGIQGWALANGFVAPGAQALPEMKKQAQPARPASTDEYLAGPGERSYRGGLVASR